jgi:hypothetical protein
LKGGKSEGERNRGKRRGGRGVVEEAIEEAVEAEERWKKRMIKKKKRELIKLGVQENELFADFLTEIVLQIRHLGVNKSTNARTFSVDSY